MTGNIGHPGNLTADQIREMSDSGLVEIASHTVTHPHLTSLDDAALDQELQDSKQTLEKITGKEVQAIAYPYSDYDQRVCTAAAKYYRFGYIDWPKNYYAQYEIGRTSVHRDITIEQFEALLH